MLVAQPNMEPDRSWITPPKVILRKNKQEGPQKLSYWIDQKGKRRLYTKEELATCNILTNLNIVLIRALILLDTLEGMNENAKVRKLVRADYSKFKATKLSIFKRFVELMAAVPDITFGEFLGFISDSRDPLAVTKIGKTTLKKAGKNKKSPFDVFYTSDLLR